MERFFNTAGPCDPASHYMLPPLQRLPTIRRFIDRNQYFVLHAARQSGKTTALMSLAQTLTSEGSHAAVLVSAEMGSAFPEDIGAAERAMLSSWEISSTRLPLHEAASAEWDPISAAVAWVAGYRKAAPGSRAYSRRSPRTR